MKQVYKIATVILLSLTGLLVFIINDDQEVFIESRESKTTLGGPVFNKIKYFRFKNKDVWMMNQSHHGFNAKSKDWDRLAIVVDKTQSPKVAQFYQLEPGQLKWEENPTEKPFRVSCFICHNNGPRVIRPNYDSLFTSSQLKEKLKIPYWNLNIKLYGRVIANKIHDQRDPSAQPPFRFRSPYENETLKIATCIKCHKESGFLARGSLVRQQATTIKFMFESGQMPPFGFGLSFQEKQELKKFLEGF